MSKRKLSDLSSEELSERMQRAIEIGNNRNWKKWVEKNGTDHDKKHGATLSINGCLVLDSRTQLCSECENHYIDNPQSLTNWLDRCKESHAIDDGEPVCFCNDYKETNG